MLRWPLPAPSAAPGMGMVWQAWQGMAALNHALTHPSPQEAVQRDHSSPFRPPTNRPLPSLPSPAPPARRKASEGSDFCFQHGGEKGGKSKSKGKK